MTKLIKLFNIWSETIKGLVNNKNKNKKDQSKIINNLGNKKAKR